jgi:hypothetical protein
MTEIRPHNTLNLDLRLKEFIPSSLCRSVFKTSKAITPVYCDGAMKHVKCSVCACMRQRALVCADILYSFLIRTKVPLTKLATLIYEVNSHGHRRTNHFLWSTRTNPVKQLRVLLHWSILFQCASTIWLRSGDLGVCAIVLEPLEVWVVWRE